jgi:hypothetical protein
MNTETNKIKIEQAKKNISIIAQIEKLEKTISVKTISLEADIVKKEKALATSINKRRETLNKSVQKLEAKIKDLADQL